jgi:hypothetical protein
MDSSKYFCEVGDAECLKVIPDGAVMSVKVTGDGACGAGVTGRGPGSPLL